MNRYTKRDTDIGAFLPDDFYEPDHVLHWVKDHNGRMVVEGEYDCVCGDAIDRLAAYEDTGLMPEEVTALQERVTREDEQFNMFCEAMGIMSPSIRRKPVMGIPITEQPIPPDELRKMNGEPVWVSTDNPKHNPAFFPTRWAICFGALVHFANPSGGGVNLATESLISKGAIFYHRKPKEGT